MSFCAVKQQSIREIKAAVRVGYYFYAEKGTYLSLEESGLKMEGDKLYATKPYLGKLHCYMSADQHTMFLIMVDTMQVRHDYPEQNVNWMIFDFTDQIDPADIDPEKEYVGLSGVESVYYLPTGNRHLKRIKAFSSIPL
ncbi:MAG: hypothetical protein Q4B01_04705 [Eubacteriales bacterium]|nr:hypothetical protein [Eubacteriales bacterium]